MTTNLKKQSEKYASAIDRQLAEGLYDSWMLSSSSASFEISRDLIAQCVNLSTRLDIPDDLYERNQLILNKLHSLGAK